MGVVVVMEEVWLSLLRLASSDVAFSAGLADGDAAGPTGCAAHDPPQSGVIFKPHSCEEAIRCEPTQPPPRSPERMALRLSRERVVALRCCV